MKKITQFTQDITNAIPYAIEAGEGILEIYKSQDFGITEKADKSPLTKADQLSHQIISKTLEQTNYPILSEEGRDIPHSERKNWESMWVVDPLDGTKEFIKQNGEFTVNIALIHEAYPVGGIVYAPVKDQLYLGMPGGHAYRIDEALKIEKATWQHIVLKDIATTLPKTEKRDHLAVVASRSHMNEDTRSFIDQLQERYEKIELLSRGSSLKLCMVAEGAADIYPRFAPTMEWDTAAGQAVAEAAGMLVVRQDMERVRYNKEDLLNPWFIVSRKGVLEN